MPLLIVLVLLVMTMFLWFLGLVGVLAAYTPWLAFFACCLIIALFVSVNRNSFKV